LHRAVLERVLRTDIPQILNSIQDDVWKLFPFCAGISEMTDIAGEPVKQKMQNFMKNARDRSLNNSILHALKIGFLRDIAVDRINDIDNEDIAGIIWYSRDALFLGRSLQCFINARSYRDAEFFAINAILPLVNHIQSDHIERLLVSVAENDQIRNARGIPRFLGQLFDATKQNNVVNNEAWRKMALSVARLNINSYAVWRSCVIIKLIEANIISDAEFPPAEEPQHRVSDE
jgi:hypothetical protein